MTSSDFTRPSSKIDRLPPILKTQVIQALIAGEPLRKIAQMAGCSHQQAKVYRDRHILPLINQRGTIIDQFDNPDKKPDIPRQTLTKTDQSTQVAENQQCRPAIESLNPEAKALVRGSPVRQGSEKLWERTERALDRAEVAVRITKDRDTGELVAIGPDIATLAKVLSVANKQIETQAKLSGEIGTEASRGPSISIQIVVPGAECSVASMAAEGTVIDVPSGARIGTKR